MNAREAEEFTQGLGQVAGGTYRLILHGWRQGVPDALGISVQDWVNGRLGGYVKLAERDRKKVIAELSQDESMSTREISAVLGVSKGTVQRDLAAAPNGAPNLDKTSRNQATSEVAAPNGAPGLPDAPPEPVPLTEREQNREERKDRDRKAAAKQLDRRRREDAVEEIPAPDLRHGTLSEALADVSDVDLVLTDPPYPREFLPVWSELAAWAANALKPGALLVAYSGQYHLPEVLARLAEHLTYQWLGWVATTGPAVSVFQRPISSMGKPLLVFSNGSLREPYSSRRFIDVAQSGGRTRELHEWEQHEAPVAYWMDALSERGELVVDPFLGSGTFAVVAKRLGRRFVGSDIDNSTVVAAKERVNEP